MNTMFGLAPAVAPAVAAAAATLTMSTAGWQRIWQRLRVCSPTPPSAARRLALSTDSAAAVLCPGRGCLVRLAGTGVPPRLPPVRQGCRVQLPGQPGRRCNQSEFASTHRSPGAWHAIVAARATAAAEGTPATRGQRPGRNAAPGARAQGRGLSTGCPGSSGQATSPAGERAGRRPRQEGCDCIEFQARNLSA